MKSSSLPVIRKLLLLSLIFLGLYFGKEFIMPLSVGIIMATLFLPFCKWLEEKKVPKIIAPLFCLLVLLIFIAGILGLLHWQFLELTSDAIILKQKAIDIFDNVQQYIYDKANISKQEQTRILREEQSSVTKVITSVLSSMAALLTNFILVLVYIYLLLYYRFHIQNFILKLSAPSQKDEIRKVISSAAKVSQQYLVGLTKMIVCLWIMYAIGFTIAGVENPFFFAILCGLLEIVPYVGNFTGVTITVLVSAVKGGDNNLLLGIVFTYGLVQFIQTWLLETIIVGPQVKINPLITILALVLGELIWGIPGIILAIPLIAMVKIVFDHVEALKPYGFLLGQIETSKKEQGFVTLIKKWFEKRK